MKSSGDAVDSGHSSPAHHHRNVPLLLFFLAQVAKFSFRHKRRRSTMAKQRLCSSLQAMAASSGSWGFDLGSVCGSSLAMRRSSRNFKGRLCMFWRNPGAAAAMLAEGRS